MSVNSVLTNQNSNLSSRILSTSDTNDDDLQAMKRREISIYPIYSEITQRVNIPFSFSILSQILFSFQFVLSGLYINSNRIWNNESGAILSLKYLLTIPWSLISTIIMFVVFLLIIIFHFLIWLQYRFTHQLNDSVLYVALFVQIYLVPFILPYYSSNFGNNLKELCLQSISVDGISTEVIVFFIMNFLSTTILFLLFSVSFFCENYSPFLLSSVSSCWDPKPFLSFHFMTNLLCFLSAFLDCFSVLFSTVITALFILLGLYFFLFFTCFPFHYIWMDCMHLGAAVCQVLFQVNFGILNVFGIHLNNVIVIPACIVIGLLSCIVFFFFLDRKKNKICSALSYKSLLEEFGKVDESVKRTRFENFHFKSFKEIITFLRVGIQFGCDLFLDFSFQHYVIENYASHEVSFEVAKLVSFFPTELQFFGYILGIVSKNLINLPITEQFLVFQLKKVYLLRQASASKEADHMIKTIHKESKDCISAIRGFWMEIIRNSTKLEFSSFLALRELTLKIDGSFQESIKRFSKNENFCREYTNFLIEAEGDIYAATKWNQKARILEQGKSTEADYSFKSLVNKYDFYLLKQLIDIKGKILIKDRMESLIKNYCNTQDMSLQLPSNNEKEKTSDQNNNNYNNTTNFSASNSLNTTTNAAVMEQKMEEMIETVIKNAKLRISLQNALKQSKLPGLSNVKFNFVLMALVSIIIFIIILSIIPSIEQDMSSIITDIEKVTNVFRLMETCSLLSIIKFAQLSVINKFGGAETIIQKLHYPREKIKSAPNAFNEEYNYLMTFSKDAFINLREMMVSLMSHSNKRESIIKNLLYTKYDYHYTYNLDIVNNSITKSPYKAAFDSFHYILKSQRLNKIGEGDSNESAENLLLSCYNLLRMSEIFETIKESLTDDASALVTTYGSLFFILELVLPIIFFVVFTTFEMYFVRILYKNTYKFICSLKRVPIETVEESLIPICINNNHFHFESLNKQGPDGAISNDNNYSIQKQPEKISIGAHQIKSKSAIAYYSFPVFTFFSILVNSILLCLPFLLGNNQIIKVAPVFEWYNLASSRYNSIFTIATGITYLGCKFNGDITLLIASANKKLKKTHMELLGGNEHVGRLVGFDQDVDKQHFLDKCHQIPMFEYDYFLCLSVDRSIDYFQYYVSRIFEQLNKTYTGGFTLNTVEYCSMVLLIDSHMSEQLTDFQTKLFSYFSRQFNKVTELMTTFCIVGIVATVAILFMSFFICHTFDTFWDGYRQLIRVLPPNDVIKNHYLMEVILLNSQNSSGNSSGKIMTVAEIIMANSSNACISVSLDHTINSVNPSFTVITGLTPDEILGQNLSVLFPFHQSNNFSSSFSSSSSSGETESLQELYERLDILANNPNNNSNNNRINHDYNYNNNNNNNYYNDNNVINNDMENNDNSVNKKLTKNEGNAITFKSFASNKTNNNLTSFVNKEMMTGKIRNSRRSIIYNPSEMNNSANNGGINNYKNNNHNSNDNDRNQSKNYVLNMKCTNSVGKALNVMTTIIAIKNSVNVEKTDSFILILRDMQAEKQSENNAKTSKKRLAKILKEMLPISVYKGLKSKETKFISNTATVVYIQIVGLMEYVNSLGPSQILQAMAKIYETYEEVIGRYNAVHPVQCFDDMLVACSGLFDFMDQPKEQVIQSVIFAMELNSLIDEINESLDVQLAFRIGINHGGPLIGNILNENTPHFILLGDLINTALKFAHGGEVGQVQISKSVVDLLDPKEFVVEKGRSFEVKGAETRNMQSYRVVNIIRKM